MSLEDEIRDLHALLASEDMVPGVALTAFDRFSDQARDAVVADVLRQFDPPPPGRLLARLQWIVTDASKPLLIGTYLTNLGSPDPKARRASLDGLGALGYPQGPDLAMAALRDSDDGVVASAVQLLAPRAAADARIRELLSGLYAAHRTDPAFHLTRAVLDAHGITPREP